MQIFSMISRALASTKSWLQFTAENTSMVNDNKSKYILNPLLSGLERVRRNGKFLR